MSDTLWPCDECETMIDGDDASGHGLACSLNPANAVAAHDDGIFLMVFPGTSISGRDVSTLDSDELTEI
jgi:hypothetical protein